jgi:aquaporin Z
MKGPWIHFLSELVGTALLLAVGLSAVIIGFGTGSPIIRLIPDPGARRLMTGFLFGTTGCLIVLSPIGKISGAHVNPVVTFAFWLMGRLRPWHAAGYILAQLGGAVFGALPLLCWGPMGLSVEYGGTLPGTEYGAGLALLGETATTFVLIVGLFLFLRHRSIRPFTPFLFPFLYAFMVYVEAPVSGTSTNPARSLGPAVISGAWHDWWVYWLGPALGAVAGVSLYRLPPLRRLEVEVAKLYHFEHDPHGVFRWKREKGKQRGRPTGSQIHEERIK